MHGKKSHAPLRSRLLEVLTIAKVHLISVDIFASLVAFSLSSLICHFSLPLLLLSNVNRYDYVTGAIRATIRFCLKLQRQRYAQVEFSLTSICFQRTLSLIYYAQVQHNVKHTIHIQSTKIILKKLKYTFTKKHSK